MIQLISHSTSNYHLLTLFIVLLISINNNQISAYSISSEFDYDHHDPIYNDLSYENIRKNELPILTNPNNLYVPDSDEIISRNPWSELFHRYYARSILTPTYNSFAQPDFISRRDVNQFVPYSIEKRLIPIELQKALFAHGIVGRRR
ncbi:unnamed protein product [Rotaria sordida]|uniref:Uncharacterized protein n=1 Tax=Rotaria sordida TaxID=392033 RepID=A0A818UZE3_9BILA|nr:unnamed protein product [Rotaria sordida]CAF0837798.1 unnamed protein product [Rotaria sordida]CAF0850460.1 unnamed protein product [Rotaria sordida]CAF1020695.1 unnamed protein product [Rotaria sordida]CAF3578965.1 unnamed protein product [Rotaria sordida]